MVQWTNKDAGNSHTTTAYHPDNEDRPLRIPAGADPWNSDYLLPDQSFSVVLIEPGVYDIAHSTKLALVDRFGNIRGYYSIDNDGLAELYHRTVRTIRVEEGE